MIHGFGKTTMGLLLLGILFHVDGGDAQARNETVPTAFDVTFRTPEGGMQPGFRCGSPKVSPSKAAEVRKAWHLFEATGERPSSKTASTAATQGSCSDQDKTGEAGCAAGDGIVPVAFHVIHNGREGDIPDTQIQSQIDVLNTAFAGAGIQFTLLTITRTLNPVWFRATMFSPVETAMKDSLAIDPTHVLNLYSAAPSGGVLGWATFPWLYPEDSTMHGVVVLYSSLPGGAAEPYDEGDTATHEAGHYLGLYHTFQEGCDEPGDEVSDTPAEEMAQYGCPVDADTCTASGLDPVTNFMDYTDDACMTEFTAGQIERANQMIELYKPGL